MKKYTLGLFLLLTSLTGICDNPRIKTKAVSPNGEYILNHVANTESSQTWELTKSGSTNLLYAIEGKYINSQTIFISDNGRHISIINDYSDLYPTNTLTVLYFYTDGELVKSYSLEDLLESVDNVSHSVSHFTWMYLQNWSDFEIDESSLSIKTYEDTAYTFNLEDGSIQKRTVEPLRAKGALYFYGDIRRLSGNQYEMDIWHRVWGEVPDNKKIVFEVDPSPTQSTNYEKYILEKGGTASCVLNRGKLIRLSDIYFNECNIINRD